MIEQSVERQKEKLKSRKENSALIVEASTVQNLLQVQITNSPPVNISTLKQANIVPKKQTKEANEKAYVA